MVSDVFRSTSIAISRTTQTGRPSGVDEVSARPPQGDEAEQLGITAGVAVLVLRKTSIDTHGRVVEISDVIMPGDRTVMTYQTSLERWPG